MLFAGCFWISATAATSSTCTNHKIDSYIYVNDGTCMGICSRCGTGGATGHAWSPKKFVAATCNQPAKTVQTCYNCNHTKETPNWSYPPKGCTSFMKYEKFSSKKHSGKCSSCGYYTMEEHKFTINEAQQTQTCYRCNYTQSTAPLEDNLQNYTWKIYKTMCAICIPLAILSFASCGFRFVGSILFGNYDSPGRSDAKKAQQQFVITVMAVLFIILSPKIIGAAIDFFSASAWTP